MANRGQVEAVTGSIFFGSIITADGDCGHEIGRCLLLGKKAMTNLNHVLESKGIISSALSIFYCPALTSVHDYWKNHSFDCTDVVNKVMSLLLNTVSRFGVSILPRSKHLLIS